VAAALRGSDQRWCGGCLVGAAAWGVGGGGPVGGGGQSRLGDGLVGRWPGRVAASVRGSGQRWSGSSPIGAAAWGVGGSSPIGGDDQSRLGGGLIGLRPEVLGGGLVWQWSEGCGSP
jgi:hypothetical protein